MSYQKIITFGSTAANSLPVYNNDPLTYCIGSNASQRFNHGSNADIYGQNSNACQVLLAQRCANMWDDVCEYASSSAANNEYATRASTMGAGSYPVIDLTPGELLLRNTAQEKYRCAMNYCDLKTEQFNPIDPTSPYISYYVGQNCSPEYEVDPKTIDSDIVMNKILDRPQIAVQMLTNIKNTMRRKGTLGSLAGTRLGKFYGLGCDNREDFTLVDPRVISSQPIASSSPYIVPTVAGLVPSQYVDWWPTQYIDFWPDEYDNAWKGAYGQFRRRRR